MNVFTTDKIRNVVLLGHGGCGKTSLVEAMAYLAGITNRMGTVEDGNTVSDYDKEETKRKISIKTFQFLGKVTRLIFSTHLVLLILLGKQKKQYQLQMQQS